MIKNETANLQDTYSQVEFKLHKKQTISLLSRSIWFFLFAFVFLLFVDEIVYCNNFCTIFYYHINASFFLQLYVYSFFLWNVSKRMTFLIPNRLKFWNMETKKNYAIQAVICNVVSCCPPSCTIFHILF